MNAINHSFPKLSSPLLYRLGTLATTGVIAVTLSACGGGGGAGTTLTPDQTANSQAEKAMGSTGTPVTSAAVWDKLNAAGADTVKSLAATSDTVTISTFTTIPDPTGGDGGDIKVFSGVVATGTLDKDRIFLLASGTLPTTGSVWVNVQNEDFTRNNAGGENALEITVAALASALAAPIP
jgi:hypothetical protein